MKHLRKFETIEEYASTQLYCPSVSLVDSNLFYENINDAETPLYVFALEDLTVSLTRGPIEYSMDLSTWTSLPAGTATPTIPQGRKVYFRANLIPYTTSANPYFGIGTFSVTGNHCLGGNIMSMRYGEDFLDNTTIEACAFYALFKGSTKLLSAARLVLPATTLASSCYYEMFDGCSSLKAAPALLATTLARNCYYDMFGGCTSLVNVPELPATTLADYCYRYMFSGCSSLKAAPALPATTLAKYCYSEMFYNCTSLVNVPAILPATTLTERCYQAMFSRCSSLKAAPALPATTLAYYCYASMFEECSRLKYIKMMATDISASYCLNDWVFRVSSGGTFVKNTAATWTATGSSGIPSGWTVETADA